MDIGDGVPITTEQQIVYVGMCVCDHLPVRIASLFV